MFEFEYDNFTDKCNGLKVVIRNTANGQIVGYATTNSIDKYTVERAGRVIGVDFISTVTNILRWITSPNRIIIDLFDGKENEDWSVDAPTNAPSKKYLEAKQEEMEELLTKQAEHFLLDYYQVENMRDLFARDEFFDKNMFVEP